jgi:hypothetical protein
MTSKTFNDESAKAWGRQYGGRIEAPNLTRIAPSAQQPAAGSRQHHRL